MKHNILLGISVWLVATLLTITAFSDAYASQGQGNAFFDPSAYASVEVDPSEKKGKRTKAEIGTELSVGKTINYKEKSLSGSYRGVDYNTRATFASATAGAKAKASISKTGIEAKAEAKIGASLISGEVVTTKSFSLGKTAISVTVGISAGIGLEASAAGGLQASKKGLSAKARASVGVGAKVGFSGGLSIQRKDE